MILCQTDHGRASYLEGHSPESPLSSQCLPETTALDRVGYTGPLSPRNAGALGCHSVCSPQRSVQKNQHCSGYWTGKKNTQEHRSSSARLPWPTFGKLVLLSMMKFQSFPFRLCATLYFLTNARLSVAAPLPASPPLAPWVMTPRTVLAKPRSTCGV